MGRLQFDPIKVFPEVLRTSEEVFPEVLRTTKANKIKFIFDMTDLLVGFDLNECML